MKKILKIMAMLLVVSAVVFAAGCSEKKADTNTTEPGAQEVTNEAPVADQNVSVDNASAEVPPVNDSITVVNDSANVTDASVIVTEDDSANITDGASVNVTEDDSANVTDDDSADENATQ